MRRSIAVAVASFATLVALGAPATAKSYTLPNAHIEVQVRNDGSIRVVEHLTYSFSGDFSGAYREIPLRAGEAIDEIGVAEGTTMYGAGAPTEIGSSGAPQTYGATPIPGGHRIVWHYAASNEMRTFTVSYTLRGVAVAHSDVVDVNLRVWGDEWTVPLSYLEAQISLPGRAPEQVRVWGHARFLDVGGTTALFDDGSGARLEATNVSPGNWVEMRIVFPRGMLTGAARGARLSPGPGLDEILAEERSYAEQAEQDAARRARDRERVQSILDRLPLFLLLGLVAATVPAGAIGTGIWLRYGREPAIAAPIPAHVFEPPGGDPPAMVAALLEPGGSKVPGDAFAATVFDLIRRGYLDAMPTMTEKKTWAGLRREDVSDLVLARTQKPTDDLLGFEREVLDSVVHAMQGDDRFHLTELHERIEAEPAHYFQVFTDFKNGVMEEVRRRGWWITEGQWPAVTATALMAVTGAGLLWIASRMWDTSRGLPWGSIWTAVAGVLFIGNAIALICFIVYRRGWERRSQEGAGLAAHWGAFRRFLGDFAGMAEAAPGSVAVWEQYLCYGIAFGVADRVLAAAQLHAPPDVRTSSRVFFVDSTGGLGSGHTSFAIADIGSAIASATPPSSGGGGGFSG
ncbi:MAG TPA: DUF2207 domain-containing protein, partial [Actinomycetota bacterium]|nr:DUF2207 domain-containing protein [Actinomycetota bacterium]